MKANRKIVNSIRLFVCILILSLVISVILPQEVYADSTATFSIEPAMVTVDAGVAFDINIHLVTDSETNSAGFQLSWLSDNGTESLTCTGIEMGDFYTGGVILGGQYSDTGTTQQVAVGLLGTVQPAGEGTLAIAHFIATQPGTYNLHLFDCGSYNYPEEDLTVYIIDGQVIAGPEGEVVVFPDANLEAVIRETINKPTGDIYQSDLLGIFSLDASTRGIADLAGLEYCINLLSLDLGHNQISNISALSGLPGLYSLDLIDNQIIDISVISSLTNLTWLVLRDNQIADISALADLTNLGGLVLENNQISDISPLSNLTGLTYLILRGNNIDDISILSNLTNLLKLCISENNVSDISSLVNLVHLQDLGLGSNPISDISVLANLTDLSSLNGGSMQVTDISPIANLTNMTKLWLDKNQITDVSALSNLNGLTELYLNSNQISDISCLSNMTALFWLDLYGNDITDISSLCNLTSLTILWLSDNRIDDISSLVSNPGIGTGDSVDISYNLLDTTPGADNMIDIQALISRGVTVVYYPQNPSVCPDWDINCDHRCDTLDFSYFCAHWNETGTPGWIRADWNCDGRVDSLDFSGIFALHWNETW